MKYGLKKVAAGVWLLTAAAILAKIIGAAYKIPLTRAIGAVGMGMYQSVYPSYALIVTLGSGGLTAAVSKAAAEEGNRVIKASACLALTVSVALTLFFAVFSGAIVRAAGAPEAAGAFLLLVLSVPFSGVCAVFKGYFQGIGKAAPSAIGQLIEQLVKTAAGLILAFWLSSVSVTAAVTGCAVAVYAGEFVTALYYFIAYRRSFKNGVVKNAVTYNSKAGELGADFTESAAYDTAAADNVLINSANSSASVNTYNSMATTVRRKILAFIYANKALMLDLLKTAVPITLGLAVLPLCRTADSFIVVNLLTKYGYDKSAATAAYGAVAGPISALINMPAVVTAGLCSVLLPTVCGMRKNGESINKTVKRALYFSLFTGIFFFAALFVFSPLVIKILYGVSLNSVKPSSYVLLKIASAAVPFISIELTASAVLQGCGKAHIPAVNLLIAGVIKELLNFILLPKAGITGFSFAEVAFYIIACTLNLICLCHVLKADKHI